MSQSSSHSIDNPDTITENAIQVLNLNKSFGEKKILCDFTFDLPKGKTYAVLGKSGSGKSVLIKCIIGLLKPDSGTINIFTKNIVELDPYALDKIRMETGFLFQSNALYDSMTVRENLEFPLRRHALKVTKEEIDA